VEHTISLIKMEKVDSELVKTSTTHYVVYVYVDYRKEIGQRMLKSFASKEAAIAYAKSLTTDYLPVGSKRKAKSEAKREDDEAEEKEDGEDNADNDDEDVYSDHEIEYTCICGRVFDAFLAEQGNAEVVKEHPDLKGEFINRIGVDEVQHIA